MLKIILSIVLLAFGVSPQTSAPTPSAEQQAEFQSVVKEMQTKREALQSASGASLSTANCGQLALAQSQLETAFARLQLVVAKVSAKLGVDEAKWDAQVGPDGRLIFVKKEPPKPQAPK